MANGRKYRKYRWLAALAAMIAVTGLSACAGSNGDGGAASGGAAPATLKVAIAAVSPLGTELYVAEQNGLFQKRGLTVEVSAVASNYTTLVVSGQADIAFGGIQTPINLQGRGEDAVVIEGHSGGGTGGTLIGTPKVKTLADLAKLPHCRIATFAEGTNEGYSAGRVEV
jgi:ABC-type nitrate/sulfonate/bicarbonate transport system substrate-binding protein